MARKGPAPRPATLQLLHGAKPSRVRVGPTPMEVELEPPDWLTEAARQEWDLVAPELDRMGIAKRVDSTGLAMYCDMVATWRKAAQLVEMAGVLITDRDGNVRRNPATSDEAAGHRLTSTRVIRSPTPPVAVTCLSRQRST